MVNIFKLRNLAELGDVTNSVKELDTEVCN